ncbi:MAG: hypothetical protein M3345_01545, partial [Actinomycetota bacterium]|nr:hypothetical protein [Actinomycetota bacterium]
MSRWAAQSRRRVGDEAHPRPGGRVSRCLARRTVEDSLRDATAPVEDPAELKHRWLYGFYVR